MSNEYPRGSSRDNRATLEAMRDELCKRYGCPNLAAADADRATLAARVAVLAEAIRHFVDWMNRCKDGGLEFPGYFGLALGELEAALTTPALTAARELAGLREAAEVLKEVERRGPTNYSESSAFTHDTCPICTAWVQFDREWHTSDCRLKAALDALKAKEG